MIDYWPVISDASCIIWQGTLEIFSGIGMVLGPSIGGGLYGVSIHTVIFTASSLLDVAVRRLNTIFIIEFLNYFACI